jgi:hypothetical protein
MNPTEQFLIQMALVYVQLQITTQKGLSAQKKADLMAFIAAGQVVVADYAAPTQVAE